MNSKIELREGSTYFLTGFFDREFRLPCISTFIYDGYDDEYGHLFRDAASHVEASEGKQSSDGNLICFPENDINGILDKKHLIEWLLDQHSPQNHKRTIEYKAV